MQGYAGYIIIKKLKKILLLKVRCMMVRVNIKRVETEGGGHFPAYRRLKVKKR